MDSRSVPYPRDRTYDEKLAKIWHRMCFYGTTRQSENDFRHNLAYGQGLSSQVSPDDMFRIAVVSALRDISPTGNIPGAVHKATYELNFWPL